MYFGNIKNNDHQLTDLVITRQVKKLKDIVEQMEAYEKKKFEPLVSESIIQLISKNKIGGSVQNFHPC